jgi:nucleotide-binding universal stress UspA family protein
MREVAAVATEGERVRRIVVGVDGSTASKDAFRWAVDQARLTGALVQAVAAWEYPPTYGWSVPALDSDLAVWAGKALSDSVEEVTASGPPVEVRETTVYGNAAQVLLAAARGAELLVVGSRGHGGFTGALLGSVSQHCVQHAGCPVVVVRHQQEDQED